MSSSGSRSPDVPLSSTFGIGVGSGKGSGSTPSTASSSSAAPNIPLTLPRWGRLGPPPPPLPHHPHSNSSSSPWSNNHRNGHNHRDDNQPKPLSRSAGGGSGGGSISLAKISNPVSLSPVTTTSEFYRRDSDEYNSALGLNRIRDHDFAINPALTTKSGGDRDRGTSESPSVSVSGTASGSSKKRRRDSEKPQIEEMDDRCVNLYQTSSIVSLC